MRIQYTPGPERKKLAAALAEQVGAAAVYAGMPSANYLAGSYTIARDGALAGPDNREMVDALRRQGFGPMKETYDSDFAQPAQPGRLTIEVRIGKDFNAAKLANLELLVASKETLLKKVLGAEALPIKLADGVVKFAWFPADGNALVYGQLACALVQAAQEATRVTAREQQNCASEKFRMRTYLLKLGFIGDSYKQARQILTRGLSGSGSYARATSQ